VSTSPHEPGPSTSTDPSASPTDGRSTPPPAGSGTTAKPKDPLRGSRTSGVWIVTVLLVVLLVLLAIFVLQNTQKVEISFLGWSGNAPLAAALLIATAAGLVLAAAAGTLRILQLRRRVKRDRKA
jgi:uncharacterized integral membrane protein